MLIPLTLVWFGALGPQDRAPNLGVGMGKNGNNIPNLILENFFKKRDLEFELNLIFYFQESDNLVFPKRVCSKRNI